MTKPMLARLRRGVLLAGATLSLAAAARPAHRPPAPAPTTHQIRMVGPADHPRFEPAEVEIASGDSVVFVVVSGQPHNVSFDSTGLAAPVRAKLQAAIHDPILPMAGPLLLKDGDRYVVSFAGIPAGRYPFFCLPHMALHMQGVVVVR